MSFDLDSLYVDPSRGEEGVWVDFFSGAQLKIAYSEGKKYKAALARLAKQHRLELDDSNENSFDLIQNITAQAMAEHLLLDWKGIVIGGEEKPYTKELGRLVLSSHAKLREFVSEKAGDPKTFSQKIIEKAKKPSSGS